MTENCAVWRSLRRDLQSIQIGTGVCKRPSEPKRPNGFQVKGRHILSTFGTNARAPQTLWWRFQIVVAQNARCAGVVRIANTAAIVAQYDTRQQTHLEQGICSEVYGSAR